MPKDDAAPATAVRKAVRAESPQELLVAVPVAPTGRLAEIRRRCDELVCLASLAGFRGVGQFYEDFTPVEDEQVLALLRRAGGPLRSPRPMTTIRTVAMDLFTRNDLKALVEETRKPCVSLFMPTRRGGDEGAPIRWKGHLGEAEERLVAAGLRAPEARELLAPARQLLADASFWRSQCDGLAFFQTPQSPRLYRLPLAFEDLAVVGDRFHITPLLPLLAGNGRFYVLALSQNGVRLLHGTRYAVGEVNLKRVPRNLAEALRTHDTDESLTFHCRPVGRLGSWGAIFSGHGVGIDDAKDDLQRYCRQIDRGLHAILRDERAPLALAAVDYLLPIYRAANTYPHLLEQAVAGNPDRLSNSELHDRAWTLLQPAFARAQDRALGQYRQLAGTGRTTSDLGQAVSAAWRGQVEVLFLARGKHRWGRFDPATGKATGHEQRAPGDEDLLNVAAVGAVRHDRTVHALEPEQVPGGVALAAVFCLPLAKRGKRP
jgi:hypothetical protein